MKKLLFATTALVATAGVASADVALTGSAEMGIIGGDYLNNDSQFHTDIDVTFTMTGESDNGISFGADIDLDESVTGASFNNRKQGGESIFISAGGATLTMGDTDGAFDKALTEVALVSGSIADDETSHAGYSGNAGLDGTYDGQIARFDYTYAGFTGSVSAEVDDNDLNASDRGTPVWGLGLAYRTDVAGIDLGVGLGYQTVEPNSASNRMRLWGLSLDAKLASGFSAAFNYSNLDYDISGAENTKHYAIGVGYEMNAFAVGVNYGKYEDVAGVDGADDAGFGLAASYDFGGGLQAQLGYGHSTFDRDVGPTPDDMDRYSLGLSMSF